MGSQFARLPSVPDQSRSRRRSSSCGSARHVRGLRAHNRGGPRFSFIDGPVTANKGDGRPHGLGADAQGRLPALQGAAGLRPALPERLGLPGPVDRGRRREGARAELQAARSRSTASSASRRSAARSSRGRPGELTRASKRLGPVDGLGQRLLHVLATRTSSTSGASSGGRRARLAVSRPSLVGVVPALRNVAVAARADTGRRLPGA